MPRRRRSARDDQDPNYHSLKDGCLSPEVKANDLAIFNSFDADLTTAIWHPNASISFQGASMTSTPKTATSTPQPKKVVSFIERELPKRLRTPTLKVKQQSNSKAPPSPPTTRSSSNSPTNTQPPEKSISARTNIITTPTKIKTAKPAKLPGKQPIKVVKREPLKAIRGPILKLTQSSNPKSKGNTHQILRLTTKSAKKRVPSGAENVAVEHPRKKRRRLSKSTNGNDVDMSLDEEAG